MNKLTASAPHVRHGRPWFLAAAGWVCLTLLAAGCRQDSDSDSQKKEAARAQEAASAGFFENVTQAAGITHRHHKPTLDHKLDNIMSWVASIGAAAAVADFDKDGWLDVYMTNSHKGTPNYLYRNNHDGTFTDVAAKAGVAELNNDDGACMDAVWADYDQDGWPDLYVVKWGYDQLFHNSGDGTFSDATKDRFHERSGGAGTAWANGAGAIWLDYNLDGRLDLYVGNYFHEQHDLWHLKTTRIMHDSFEHSRNAGRNFLYRQEPDGTFTNVAPELQVDDAGWTLAVGSGDVNNDGWPDLYCADDFGPDQLFVNNGDGTFANVSKTALAYDTRKGMNAEFADFDNDGWLDIYVANITTAEYLQEGNMLWHNDGPDEKGNIQFTDVALETGTYDGGWGWGAKMFDFDNDGDQDIMAVNGFISAGEGNYWYDLASWTVTGEHADDAANWPAIGNRSFSGYEKTRFWRNDGFLQFTEVAKLVGTDDNRDGRGLAYFDYDNDGDLDLLVANQDHEPILYRNIKGNRKHWLMVDLEADPVRGANRDAIGARVTAVTDRGRQIREKNGGNGYAAQSDPRQHFGFADEDRIRLLEVRWPDGSLQYIEDVPADQHLRVVQQSSMLVDARAGKLSAPAAPVKMGQSSDKKPAVLSIPPEEQDKYLSKMEDQIRVRMDDCALMSAYRGRCVAYEQYDRSIDFLKGMVEGHPDNRNLRLQLATAYVDKIPTCGGIAAIVSKGTLAKKSLDQLDHILQADPDWWPALYSRGLNHLHWPKALLHTDSAIADFERCLSLQRTAAKTDQKRYFVRTYIVLGDAYAKNKQGDKAKQMWKEGQGLFPDEPQFAPRLALGGNSEMADFVEKVRNLEQPIDTDMSFLDESQPSAEDGAARLDGGNGGARDKN